MKDLKKKPNKKDNKNYIKIISFRHTSFPLTLFELNTFDRLNPDKLEWYHLDH